MFGVIMTKRWFLGIVLVICGLFSARAGIYPVSRFEGINSVRVFSFCLSPDDVYEKILLICGASSIEELSQEELEQFESLMSKPLRINMVKLESLVSSSLFTYYQAIALNDYINKEGDVLSLTELALVDGFDKEYVSALEPFISFESRSLPGYASIRKSRVDGEIQGKTSVAVKEGERGLSSGTYMKGRIGSDGRWEIKASYKTTLEERTWSASAQLSAKRILDKLIVGDFNAKIGQGVLVWTGSSLSGFSTASSFDRHPSGISQAWTISPDRVLRGIASQVSLNRIHLSGWLTIDGTACAAIGYYGRNGQVGASVLSGGHCSADFRCSPGKWDIYGEFVLYAKKIPAFYFGTSYNPAYQVRLSLSVRNYPSDYNPLFGAAPRSSTKTSDERGVAIGLDAKSLSVTLDTAYHPSKGQYQIKNLAKYQLEINEGLSFGIRAVTRYRPADTYPLKFDTRLEMKSLFGPGLCLNTLAQYVRNEQSAWLVYLEPGFVSEKAGKAFSTYFRTALFCVDSWNDRIYVYEKDIPGAFSVPAYYGRGYSLSWVGGYKTRHFSLSFRASMISYPFMKENKPGKAELKLYAKFGF